MNALLRRLATLALVAFAAPAAWADTGSILTFAVAQEEAPKETRAPQETPAPEATPTQEPLPSPTPDPRPARRAPHVTSGTFIDFTHLEAGIRGGMILYSGDFESDPMGCGSVIARAPMPFLSRQVFGLRKDDFGVYLQIGASSIDRDFTPALDEPSGTLFFVGTGIDYNVYADSTIRVKAQLGLQYNSFGGVSDTDDGVGAVIGFLGAVRVASGVSVGYSPEFVIGSGDWMMLNQLGVMVWF